MIIGFVPNVGKFAIVVRAGKSKSSIIYILRHFLLIFFSFFFQE